MIAVPRSAGFHTTRVRAVSVLGKSEATDAFTRYQPGQPAFVLFRRPEAANCIYGESALDRCHGTKSRVRSFQFLHDQAVGGVAQPSASVFFQEWCIEAQLAHARREMFWKFSRPMARHDLRQSFLLHKTSCPIPRGALLLREKFFDGVVIQRGHVMRFHECAKSNGHATRKQRASLRLELSVLRTRAHHFRLPRVAKVKAFTPLTNVSRSDGVGSRE